MPRAFAASFHSSSSAAADSSPEAALRRHLAALGLPPGLLPAVRREHAACHSQLWLLDNSAGMRADCAKPSNNYVNHAAAHQDIPPAPL